MESVGGERAVKRLVAAGLRKPIRLAAVAGAA